MHVACHCVSMKHLHRLPCPFRRVSQVVERCFTAGACDCAQDELRMDQPAYRVEWEVSDRSQRPGRRSRAHRKETQHRAHPPGGCSDLTACPWCRRGNSERGRRAQQRQGTAAKARKPGAGWWPMCCRDPPRSAGNNHGGPFHPGPDPGPSPPQRHGCSSCGGAVLSRWSCIIVPSTLAALDSSCLPERQRQPLARPSRLLWDCCISCRGLVRWRAALLVPLARRRGWRRVELCPSRRQHLSRPIGISASQRRGDFSRDLLSAGD